MLTVWESPVGWVSSRLYNPATHSIHTFVSDSRKLIEITGNLHLPSPVSLLGPHLSVLLSSTQPKRSLPPQGTSSPGLRIPSPPAFPPAWLRFLQVSLAASAPLLTSRRCKVLDLLLLLHSTPQVILTGHTALIIFYSLANLYPHS